MAETSTIPELEDIVKKQKGKKKGETNVDWAKLRRLDKTRREYIELEDKVLEYLKENGVLVHPQEGSFLVLKDRCDSSPVDSSGVKYHFKKPKAAEEFAKAYYSGIYDGFSIAVVVKSLKNRGR